MKNSLFITFRILLWIVLLGKILNWFLDFNENVNMALTIALFTLIGIAYVIGGYIWRKQPVKTIFLLCGMYLVLMNFFANNAVLSVSAIICILCPCWLSAFQKTKIIASTRQKADVAVF